MDNLYLKVSKSATETRQGRETRNPQETIP